MFISQKGIGVNDNISQILNAQTALSLNVNRPNDFGPKVNKPKCQKAK
jgi:hypothetical protein